MRGLEIREKGIVQDFDLNIEFLTCEQADTYPSQQKLVVEKKNQLKSGQICRQAESVPWKVQNFTQTEL